MEHVPWAVTLRGDVAAARPRMPGALRVVVTLPLYVGLMLMLTYPLAAHLRTRLPFVGAASGCDLPYITWALAEETHVLLTHPSHLADANIFYPARHTLFLGDTGFGALPLFMPVFLLTGNPTLGINLVFLGGLALSAWALHVVVFLWTGSQLAGVVAAWTLLTSWIWSLAPSAPTYALLQYFPAIILLASVPARRFRGALALVPFVVLQCLSDVLYLAAAVLAPLGLLATARLLRPGTRRAGLRLFAVLAIALLVILPVHAAHLVVNRDLVVGSPWAATTWPTPLPWGPFRHGPLALPAVVWVLIGTGSLAFALAPGRRGDEAARRGWLHGAFWASAGLLISMTPETDWQGGRNPLPYVRLAQHLGIYEILRMPVRLGIAGLMGLAILAGLAFAECARPLSGRRWAPVRLLAAILVAAAMFVSGSLPLPGRFRIMEAVRGDSPLIPVLRGASGPILELPVGDVGNRGLPSLQARAMYRSIFHWRPLLNGYSSYWPAGFIERMLLAARLPDASALEALQRETDLTTILVHLDELNPADRLSWLTLADSSASGDLRLSAREGSDLVFEVTPRSALRTR